MIELKGIGKIYKSKKANNTVALDNINLILPNKGMIFIVGKSGSGKSTLLNILGGLDNPTTGELIINGKNISKFRNKQYDSYRNTYVGFVFQEFNLLEQYNVYQNIELAVELQKRKISHGEIANLLEQLGIKDLERRKINELSGGQKQRIAIARALIKKPEIILADEPTGNLDSSSSEQIFNILKKISEKQLVVVVSHDLDSADKYAERIIKIEDGKIISDNQCREEIEQQEFHLKKSHLPFLYTLKMAFNSLKAKPFRLFMTILLTAISLVFMGITVNFVLFEANILIINTMKDNDSYVYEVTNTKVEPLGSKGNYDLTKTDLNKIKNDTKSILNPIYYLQDDQGSLKLELGSKDELDTYFKNFTSFNFVEINDSKILGNLIGRAPSKNNEIVIHKYLADYIITYGVIDISGTLYYPSSYQDLIDSNKKLKLGSNEIVITGIIDEDLSIFNEAKKDKCFKDQKLEQYFIKNIDRKSNNIYVKGLTNNVILKVNKDTIINRMSLQVGNRYASNFAALKEETTILTANGIKKVSSLEKDEVIISIEYLKQISPNYQKELETYLKNNSSGSYANLVESFTIDYIKTNLSKINPTLTLYSSSFMESPKTVKTEIIGVNQEETNLLSNKYVDEYEPINKKITSVLIYDNNKQQLKEILNKYPFYATADEVGTYYTISVDNQEDIAYVISLYKYLYLYILIVSLVFILFTMLLFANFISVSISYAKKEIGILRAIGASTFDIIKIFAYESIFIAIMSWILSVAGWVITCNLLNTSMFGSYYFTLNGIILNPIVPIGMFIFTILIAIIITVLSISHVTKIKPIEAILNK